MMPNWMERMMTNTTIQPQDGPMTIEPATATQDERMYDVRKFRVEPGCSAALRVRDGLTLGFGDVPVIGVMGDIKAGKSTLAKMLAERGFAESGFADDLKRDAIRKYGLEYRHCFGTQDDKMEPLHHLPPVPSKCAKMGEPWASRTGKLWRPRWILEWEGTEGSRTIKPDVWVDLAIKAGEGQVKADRHKVVGIVFPDVRFRNEAAAIRRQGGQLWRVGILGPDGYEISDQAADRTNQHDSNNEWRRIEPDVHLVGKRGALPRIETLVRELLSLSGI